MPLLRHQFIAWLRDLQWPAEEASDLAVAVNEAVSNVVEHAYPTLQGRSRRHRNSAAARRVIVLVQVDTAVLDPRTDGLRWVRATIRDRGRWRADVPDHDVPDHEVPDHDVPECEVPARFGGRGLQLMRALTDDVAIVFPVDGGTEVTLVSPAVRLPPVRAR